MEALERPRPAREDSRQAERNPRRDPLRARRDASRLRSRVREPVLARAGAGRSRLQDFSSALRRQDAARCISSGAPAISRSRASRGVRRRSIRAASRTCPIASRAKRIHTRSAVPGSGRAAGRLRIPRSIRMPTRSRRASRRRRCAPRVRSTSRISASSSCPTTWCASRRRPTTRCSSSCSPPTKPPRRWRRGTGRARTRGGAGIVRAPAGCRTFGVRRSVPVSCVRPVQCANENGTQTQRHEERSDISCSRCPSGSLRLVLGASAPALRARWGKSPCRHAIRRGRLYQNLVDATLQFLIEQVGGVEGVYTCRRSSARQFPRPPHRRQRRRGARHRRLPRLAGLGARGARGRLRHGAAPDPGDRRRAQGAGPAGEGRALHQRRADARRPRADLVTPGLHDQHAAARRAGAARGVAGDPRRRARPGAGQPAVARDDRRGLDGDEGRGRARGAIDLRNLIDDGGRRGKGLPEGVRWLSASAIVGAARTGQVVAGSLLDYYKQTLDELQKEGFVAYASRQMRPYLRAAVGSSPPHAAP